MYNVVASDVVWKDVGQETPRGSDEHMGPPNFSTLLIVMNICMSSVLVGLNSGSS